MVLPVDSEKAATLSSGCGPCCRVVGNVGCSGSDVSVRHCSATSTSAETMLGPRPSCINAVQLEMDSTTVIFADDTLAAMHKFRPEATQQPSDSHAHPSSTTHYWSDTGSLLIYFYGKQTHSSKVAAFDLDGTLIRTVSGRVFAVDCNDWTFCSPSVIPTLRTLSLDGYRIVIMTNQKNLKTDRLVFSRFQAKLNAVAQALAVPLVCYAATQDDLFRKPRLGMWNRFCSTENGHCTIDSSFYVGDAAGRAGLVLTPADHSLADILFAANANLVFKTPEAFFHGIVDHRPLGVSRFQPAAAIEAGQRNSLFCPVETTFVRWQPELILTVGCPGSGKWHLFDKFIRPMNLYSAVRCNSEMTAGQCSSEVMRQWENGRSVFICGRHPSAHFRTSYVQMARRLQVPIRCFLMDISYEQSRHNLVFKQLVNLQPVTAARHELALNQYMQTFQHPCLAEGFDEIVTVNFVPQFACQADQMLYSQFLLEK